MGLLCCAGLGSQAQSHALLRQLLLLLRLGSKREAVRSPLLDALLSYLQACRGPRIAHASADLFQAAISGHSPGCRLKCNMHMVQSSAQSHNSASSYEEGCIVYGP